MKYLGMVLVDEKKLGGLSESEAQTLDDESLAYNDSLAYDDSLTRGYARDDKV